MLQAETIDESYWFTLKIHSISICFSSQCCAYALVSLMQKTLLVYEGKVAKRAGDVSTSGQKYQSVFQSCPQFSFNISSE